jgi:hypothetical protein
MSLGESYSLASLTRGATELTLTKQSPGKYFVQSQSDDSPITMEVSGSRTAMKVSVRQVAYSTDNSVTPGRFNISVIAGLQPGVTVTETNLKSWLSRIASVLTDTAFVEQLLDGER